MLIDWFTVAAQAVNFLILVWLLQHFLYKPILTAIDARETKIAAAVAAAAARQCEAQQSSDALAGRLKAFDDERAARMAQATLEVQQERERLLDAARREAADLVARQRSTLSADAASIGDRMAQLATAEVFSIAGKAFNELASAELEERLDSVFTQRLRQLGKEAKAAFATALGQSPMSATIRSRFAIGDAQKASLHNAVNETFSADVHLEFETVPAANYGIELTAGGQRLAWGIQEYIKDFQEKAQALMTPAPAPAVAAAPTPAPAVAAAPTPAPAVAAAPAPAPASAPASAPAPAVAPTPTPAPAVAAAAATLTPVVVPPAQARV
jgi:F-type H+-transporting ATPase subunit b